MSDAVLQLAQALIRRPSVTPADGGCQALLLGRLRPLGFRAEALSKAGVANFYAEIGEGSPRVAFAGHTDVVPPGDAAHWRSPPFEPTIRDGCLFGRGAADMKSGLAAMLVAAERFLAEHPRPRGHLAFLVTSDEEGDAQWGTRHIAEHLQRTGRVPDHCIIGEPSSSHCLGDAMRNGRRGSLNGRLTVHGVQGHVAYPDLAANPVHIAAPLLADLLSREFDRGNAHYPPTCLQVSNIAAGTGALNVIPGQLTVDFNFRYCTEQTAEGLQALVERLVAERKIDASLAWRPPALPFLTAPGRLTEAVQRAVRQELGRECRLSTAGGTSDGRFIAPLGCEVVELGPVNQSIHQVDECVAIADLDPLARVYQRILKDLLAP